jgi:hypothetical protein
MGCMSLKIGILRCACGLTERVAAGALCVRAVLCDGVENGAAPTEVPGGWGRGKAR